MAGPLAALALAALTGLAIADALPPARLRDRPGIDLATIGLAALLLVLSGALAAGAGLDALPWMPAVAFAAWSMGIAALRRIAALPEERATGASGGTAGVLGPRVTAWLALVDIILATIVTLLTGGLAVAAAIGVATYLLLPAMVVTRPADPAIAVAAARDALRERRGLDVLVGAWLVALLARHWGIVTWDAWTVVVVLPGALVAIVLVNILATRVASRSLRPSPGASPPSLDIVVPCHDDADRLPACLTAIRAQTYADTGVLVVDTGSTDGSQDEAAAWIGDDVVLDAPPAPPGWGPREWGRHVGATSSDAELVLFVAPDTILAPVAARMLVETLQARRLDLLSGVPRDLMPTSGERAAVPGFALTLFGLVPLWWSASTGGRPAGTAFADSGLVLVRREAYLATTQDRGADAGVIRRGSVGDGPRLARAFVEQGQRVGLIHAARIAARRRTTSVAGAVGIWRRRTARGGDVGIATAIVGLLLATIAFAFPLLLPLFALVSDLPLGLTALTVGPLVLLVIARVLLALTQRQPLLSILWHPVTVAVTLIGQGAGIADRVTLAHTFGSLPASPDILAMPDPRDDEPLDDPFGDLPEPMLGLPFDPPLERPADGGIEPLRPPSSHP